MDESFQGLNSEERYRLLTLLWRLEYLFDGTLGMWSTTLVDLELKDNKKPVCL